MDFARLRAAVRLAVRFLHDVIDVNHYSVPELEGPAQAARWPPRSAGPAVPDPAHSGCHGALGTRVAVLTVAAARKAPARPLFARPWSLPPGAYPAVESMDNSGAGGSS